MGYNFRKSKKSTRALIPYSKNNLLVSKRSQSEVISTVLLILLVIVSFFIIISFVIPFVKEQLSSTDCIDVSDKIEIKENDEYTCYDSNLDNMNVQIHIGDISGLIKGFQISVESGGSSKTAEVYEGSSEIQMYGGGTVELPGKNEERTYIISGITSLPSSISVYPVLNNGKSCDASDIFLEVKECT